MNRTLENYKLYKQNRELVKRTMKDATKIKKDVGEKLNTYF